MNFRFLFNPQNGLYQGIVRGSSPDNSTTVRPHFSVGYKTCWDFQGRWKLVREDEFFEHVYVQDILRDYDRSLKREVLGLEKVMQSLNSHAEKNRWELARANILEHQRTRSVLSEQLMCAQMDIEARLDRLDNDFFMMHEKICVVLDILTAGPLKRKMRQLRSWLSRLIG